MTSKKFQILLDILTVCFYFQMKPVIIKRADIVKPGSDLNIDLIGKPILKSLREQRRSGVLCDVYIECEDQQILAHRCILYAASKYCKTLFTGPLSPTLKNGILMMELNLFSYDTVQTFIDLIYGEDTSGVSEIDAGELLRLGDYLQVPVNILTDTLCKIIDKDNCVRLFELSLLYNCCKLQHVLASYISNNLKELMGHPSWELSESALCSLQKHPLYVSRPLQLIGADSKEKGIDLSVPYSLMAYDDELRPTVQSNLVLVENDASVSHFKNQHGVGGSKREIMYFIFNHELYFVRSDKSNTEYNIYKYIQQNRWFQRIVFTSNRHIYIGHPRRKPFPLYLRSVELSVKMVITSLSYEHIYILFCAKGDHIWLMKWNIVKAQNR